MIGASVVDGLWLRRVIAAGFILLISGFSASVPVFAGGLTPSLFVLCVFIITLYAPETLPPLWLVLLSLLQDVWVNAALGLTGFSCLLLIIICSGFRRALIRQAFHVVWLSLAAMLFAEQLFTLVFLRLFSLSYSVESAFTSWAFTLIFIPLLHPLLVRVIR